jgi:hypothetical protein
VEAVDGAEHHLLSYLALPLSLYDLRLRIPEAVLCSEPVRKLLKSAFQQERRFAYDRETTVLRVYAMSRAIHDAILPFVAKFCTNTVLTNFVTLEEHEHIQICNSGVLLSRSYTHENTKKIQAWTKYPDAAIAFGALGSKFLPSVVFEVGFAESYDDLVSDAAQWLQRSGGMVRLAIIVTIKEDVQDLRARQKSSAVKRRIRGLVVRFGNAKGKDQEKVDHGDSDVESDAEMYRHIESLIVTEDWVGPINATLEVWHMADGTPTLRQPPIVSLHYHF